MSFDNMLSQFKDYAELRIFAESQNKTILDLSKKNHELEKEVSHLKTLLTSNKDLVLDKQETGKIVSVGSLSDEEAICRTQLKLLNRVSIERELTYEECKKVDVYTKVLLSITRGSEVKDNTVKKMDNKDLIALLNEQVLDEPSSK